MQLIRQPIQMLELFHHHLQLLRLGIKNAIQHALQTANRRRQRGAKLMRHRHMRGAEFFIVAGQLAGHFVKVGGKADHFRRRVLNQLRLAAKLPPGDVLRRITKTAELQMADGQLRFFGLLALGGGLLLLWLA